MRSIRQIFLLSLPLLVSARFSLGYNLGAMLETSDQADQRAERVYIRWRCDSYGATEQAVGLFIEVFGALGLSAEESPAAWIGTSWLFKADAQLDVFAGVQQ